MGKLSLSIPTIRAGVGSLKARSAISIWSGRKTILQIAFSALAVLTISVTWVHWQASTKVAPPQAVRGIIDKSILRLSSSKTIGSVLAPELVKAWLVSIGASDVEQTERIGRDSDQIPESVISARINEVPVVVEVRARGSASAFKDMATGDADIGITSREINSSELTTLMPLGDMRSQTSEHVLGAEGIALIVPQSNTISSLSRSTLKKIFTGQITDWSAVGRKRLPIHLYARDKDSRTSDKFASLVLGDDPMADTKRYQDNAKLESDVANDPGGIGFVGMPYVKDTRSVSISDEAAEPLKRQLYLYTAASPRNPTVIDFLRFAISAQGQNIVRQARFVPASGDDSVSSNNSVTIAALKVSISDDGVKQSLPAPLGPSRFTLPSAAAVLPGPATDLARAPSGPPTVTASLQAPPPSPAITASLQAPTPPVPQATPPEATAAPVLPPQGAEAPSPVVPAAPPPPAPDHLTPPAVVSVTPPPASPAPSRSTPAVPINSHAVTSADYPLNSIRVQQQGAVVVKYLIKEDGSVGDCTVTTSSGKVLLDLAACAMVKRRWKFKPATQDGKPIAEFLTAEVVFKLADVSRALRPTIMASLSPPPAAAAFPPEVKVTPDLRLPIPPVAITNHAITPNDYPILSRTMGQQGNVEVRYLVKEDGSVGDCTVTISSGKPLLDDAACAMVKRRWKFKPATQDGKPIAESLTAEVVFRLK